jgi:hypothetical protein
MCVLSVGVGVGVGVSVGVGVGVDVRHFQNILRHDSQHNDS